MRPSLRAFVASRLASKRFNRPLPGRPPRSVLLIRLDLFGDHLLFGGFLQNLRRAWPDTRIVLLCRPRQKTLYDFCPCVDEVLTHDDGAPDRRAERERLFREVRKRAPEWIVNPMRERPKIADTLLRYCPASVRVGFTGSPVHEDAAFRERHNAYYSHLIESRSYEPWRAEGAVNRMLLAYLTGQDAPPCRPQIWTSPDDEAYAESIFQQSGFDPKRTVVYFTGASQPLRAFPALKNWVAEVFSERDWSVIAVGAPEEFAGNEPPQGRRRWLNLCRDATFGRTAALMRRARLVIGVESGLAQLAAAVDVPHILLTSGTFFGRFLPATEKSALVINPLDCYFCAQACRFAQPYCMTDLSFRVFRQAVAQTLAEEATEARVYRPKPSSIALAPSSVSPTGQWDDRWIAADVTSVPTVALRVGAGS